MSGPTRSPSGGPPRQPWSPEGASKGITCPACGLANEAGARVCRNCGLPIASATDPVRGVAPGRVDMPSAQRSGLSAVVGFALVIGLLLVAGTLAVSGGGILTSGGRLGVEPAGTPSPGPAVDGRSGDGTPAEPGSGVPGSDIATPAKVGTSINDFICEDGVIADLSRGKWDLNVLVAGSRVKEGYDRITFRLTRKGKAKAKEGTNVTMEWFDEPKDAQSQYGFRAIGGDRAVVVTFDGPVGITANQVLDSLYLEPEGVSQIRKIQMTEGEDGKVRVAVGLRGESCARIKANGWKNGATAKEAKVFLDIERF